MFLDYLLPDLSIGPIRIIIIVLALMSLIILYRRFSICAKSGGKFFSSYNIKDGYLYIHSGLMPGKRKISHKKH